MGMRRLFMILAGLAVLTAGAALPLCAVDAGALPFAPGETLTYDITWSVFYAGQVVAKLEKDDDDPGDDYDVTATATSAGFASLLYKVQDHFRSVLDPQTLCSRGIQKTVNEGRRHKKTDIVFNSSRRVAILDERDLSKPRDPVKHKENPIAACTQDVVSAFYYLRSQPMHVGEKIHLAVNDGSKTKEVVADVVARERIETPMGAFEAFRVEPTVFGSLYKRRGRMLLWISDDPHHLPLRIKAELSLGAITGTLTSVSGEPIKAPAEPSSLLKTSDSN
jgi:Protein of unknown function (DUF3108)